MKRGTFRIAIVLMALVALNLVVWWNHGYWVWVYGVPGRSSNGGVVVEVRGESYGLEVWGHPGFFHNAD